MLVFSNSNRLSSHTPGPTRGAGSRRFSAGFALGLSLALLASCSGHLGDQDPAPALEGRSSSKTKPAKDEATGEARDEATDEATGEARAPDSQERGEASGRDDRSRGDGDGGSRLDAGASEADPDEAKSGDANDDQAPGDDPPTKEPRNDDELPLNTEREPDANDPAAPIARRLSNQELANTLANLTASDPQWVLQALPTDSHTHLFDRIGRDQSISSFHLEGYERLASDVVAQLLGDRQLDELTQACSDAATPAAKPPRTLSMKGAALAIEPAWALCSATPCEGDAVYTLYADEVTATTNQALEAPGDHQLSLQLEARQDVDVTLSINGEPVESWEVESGAITLKTTQHLEAGSHLFEYALRFRSAAQTQTSFAAWSLEGPIDTSQASDDERQACLDGLIDDFAPRAYRRPLAQRQRQRLRDLAESAWQEMGYQAAVSSLLHAILESPYTLYHIETRTAESAPFEIANRLAYALWEGPPDEALLQDARADRLDAERVRAHAERMTESPAALRTVQRFFLQWMGLTNIDSLTKDPAVLPAFSSELGAAMRQEFERFIEGIVWEQEAPARELLLADYSWVPPELNAIYQLEAAPDGELMPVEAQRAGLLTLPAVLASHAKFDETSPVLRGVFVLRNFLCVDMPPPPASLNITPPPFDPDKTTRERWAAHSSTPGCSGCHDSIDPLGFALEGFDALGQVRTTERGFDIDTRGGAKPLGIGPMELSGSRELGDALALSTRWHECLTRQWLNFMRGDLHPADDARIGRLAPAPDGDAPLKTLFIESAVEHALGR